MLKALGKNPSGERLMKIKKSVAWQKGVFKNLLPTEVILKNTSYPRLILNFLNKPKNTVPSNTLPSVKTDLISLSGITPSIVWFGHSSYFIKSRGVNVLVDPVFSGNASPVTFFGRSFKGSDIYSVSDLPPVDIVVLTHDHYDHLDYKTIKELKERVKIFCVPLGVGSHLEYWSIKKESIVELDWWEDKQMMEEVVITATPARHFSGRGLLRGKTLWTSYVLTIHGKKIFLGGDSGYDGTFKRIGEKYGPFDLAILEAGQY